MIVSLYISRVLLQMLGVDDFGIYSVVGSITGMFASIKSVFAEATQRYLNNAKGRKEDDLVRKIFSTSMLLHMVVGLLFVIIVFAVGEFLLNNTLNIPNGRASAAHMAFYFSVLSIFIIILTIPYDAVIMANEKINVYSIVSIVDSLLKLLIVLVVPLFSSDNLVVYTMLLCVVSFFTLVVYYVYTRRFSECKIEWKINPILIRELGNFSFWNFIGNFIFSIVHEAYNMLLNVYGGVVSNAARSIAYQVRAAVGTFTNNALIAVKPFVMQETANKDRERIFDYIIRISSFTYYMSLVISLIIIFSAPKILNIWLSNVPEGAVTFTQLVVMALLIRSLHGPLSLMFVSFAKIKSATIGEGLLYLLSVLVVYLMLRFGLPLWSMFIFLCIVEAMCIVTLAVIAKRELNFDCSIYFHLLNKLVVLTIISVGIIFLFRFVIIEQASFVSNLIAKLFVEMILTTVISTSTIYIFMSNAEKGVISSIYSSIVKKK